MQTKPFESYGIKNIETWSDSLEPIRENLLIENGILTQRGAKLQLNCEEIFDGSNSVLVPAGIDPQVHLRVPGQEIKEDARSGITAALAGGFSAILTMPNTTPTIDNVETLKLAQSLISPIEDELGVTVKISAAISMRQKGKHCVNFKELIEHGAHAFTDDGVGVVAEDIMHQAFKVSAETSIPILQHAEFPGHGGILAPGPIQEKLSVKAYPESAEWEMITRDLEILKLYPEARYHVLHLSCVKSVELIRKAKEDGFKVTCEVTPHHLLFNCEDIDPERSSFKMNPPLRSKEDQNCLRKALADGVIDFVATDHAPHEPAVKSKNFKTSAFGTTGLGASLRVLLTMLKQGEITQNRLVEVFAKNPAKFLGLDTSFGSIQTGKTFRGVILDSELAASPFREDQTYSKSNNSIFIGALLNGLIRKVVLGKNVNTFN